METPRGIGGADSITRISLRNFKRFESAEIEIGSSSVFIGPNNAGKTTVLQAFALWDLGPRVWLDKTTEIPADRNRRP